MATPWDMDVLGTMVRSAGHYIYARIPDEEAKSNEDLKRLAYLREEVIYKNSENYLFINFDAIRNEIKAIKAKYSDMPMLWLKELEASKEKELQKAS